jgi:ribose transport system substrate-binding protein
LRGLTGASAFLRGRRRRLSRWAAGALAALAVAGWLGGPGAQERRYTVAFANLTEEPGVTLEGTGFTGREVRQSFELAARRFPVDLVFYDNQRDDARARANAEDAIGRRVDLYVLYPPSPASGAAVAEKLRAARIPVLVVNQPVDQAPLYTVDNLAAGRLAGEALGEFASRTWRALPKVVVIVGPLQGERLVERAQGVVEGLRPHLPAAKPVRLDTQGNPAQVAPQLEKLLAAHPGSKILIAAMDDTTALAAKAALESSGRLRDAAIVSHGVDRSIHGGINDRKEIDPTNRGSIVIGSVAFYLDRYGYDVLPLAMRMLRGEAVPPRTATRHRLVTAANVFIEYPPYDMN